MTNDILTGLNKVPPKSFKSLNDDNLTHLLDFFKKCCLEETDFYEWHEGQIIPVPKSEDLYNTNKCRGVALMDIGAKIFTSIPCGRAFKIIKAHGVKYQFGYTPGVGCQDIVFTLKTLIHLRHNYNLPSWVSFACLVKYFNTSNQKFLVSIPSRHGTLPHFCSEIMYENSVLRLIVGKIDTSIPFKED